MPQKLLLNQFLFVLDEQYKILLLHTLMEQKVIAAKPQQSKIFTTQYNNNRE